MRIGHCLGSRIDERFDVWTAIRPLGHKAPGSMDNGIRVIIQDRQLSLGGCRIRTWERFPVGIYRRVETEFTLDGLPFRLAGVVQTIHDRRTVGIRFLDMSSRKRDQLAQSLRELEEHPAEDTRAE